jgi:hypothetical protein
LFVISALVAEPEIVNFGNVQLSRVSNPKYKLNIRNVSSVDLDVRIRLEDERSKDYFGISYLQKNVFFFFYLFYLFIYLQLKVGAISTVWIDFFSQGLSNAEISQTANTLKVIEGCLIVETLGRANNGQQPQPVISLKVPLRAGVSCYSF